MGKHKLWLTGTFLAALLAFASPATAATSEPMATSCIRVRGGAAYGTGQTNTSFWGYFQNICGATVNQAVFDALLFWCDGQANPGSSCASTVILDKDLTRSFEPYQIKKINYLIPSSIQGKLAVGYYQWDINLKVQGCTDHGDCWSKAKDLPGTWGAIYWNSLNAGKECLQGQTRPCDSGCGTVTCSPAGTWDGSQCVAKNPCGQCPGTPGSATCCAGVAPACGSCTTPVCAPAGWTCAEKPRPACSGCDNAVCVDEAWVCQQTPPPIMIDCENPVCQDGAWSCYYGSEGAPADPDAPPPAATPTDSKAGGADQGGEIYEYQTDGGCSLAAGHRAPVTPRLPAGSLVLLALVALALGRRYR